MICHHLPLTHAGIGTIIQISHYFGGEGFQDLAASEVKELIISHTEELTEVELEEILLSNRMEEDLVEGYKFAYLYYQICPLKF